MNDTQTDHRHAVALFRYGLIADLAQLPPGSKGLYALIDQKAEREYTIPGTTRTRVAPETFADWLKRYAAVALVSCCPSPGLTGAAPAPCPLRWQMPCSASRRAIRRCPCNWC